MRSGVHSQPMTNTVRDQVRQVAADVFNVPVDQLSLDTTRDDVAQWDSLHHINLVIALEQTFDIQFTPEHMEQMLSLELVALIVGELTTPKTTTRD
jgi:acyl carrier protein